MLSPLLFAVRSLFIPMISFWARRELLLMRMMKVEVRKLILKLFISRNLNLTLVQAQKDSIADLEKQLEIALEKEDYEKASKLRDELNKRKKK